MISLLGMRAMHFSRDPCIRTNALEVFQMTAGYAVDNACGEEGVSGRESLIVHRLHAGSKFLQAKNYMFSDVVCTGGGIFWDQRAVAAGQRAQLCAGLVRMTRWPSSTARRSASWTVVGTGRHAALPAHRSPLASAIIFRLFDQIQLSRLSICSQRPKWYSLPGSQVEVMNVQSGEQHNLAVGGGLRDLPDGCLAEWQLAGRSPFTGR